MQDYKMKGEKVKKWRIPK